MAPHFEVDVPFFARLTVHFPDHGRLSILNAASPVSARKTRLFVPIVRNFDKDLPLDDVYAFNRQVFEEDRAIVEQQRPEDSADRPHGGSADSRATVRRAPTGARWPKSASARRMCASPRAGGIRGEKP